VLRHSTENRGGSRGVAGCDGDDWVEAERFVAHDVE